MLRIKVQCVKGQRWETLDEPVPFKSLEELEAVRDLFAKRQAEVMEYNKTKSALPVQAYCWNWLTFECFETITGRLQTGFEKLICASPIRANKIEVLEVL